MNNSYLKSNLYKYQVPGDIIPVKKCSIGCA